MCLSYQRYPIGAFPRVARPRVLQDLRRAVQVLLSPLHDDLVLGERLHDGRHHHREVSRGDAVVLYLVYIIIINNIHFPSSRIHNILAAVKICSEIWWLLLGGGSKLKEDVRVRML